MKWYEFIYVDECCIWNWEDDERNVILQADNYKEAEKKFLSNVDSEYEEQAERYCAREIDDIYEYTATNYVIIWEG